MPMYRAELVDRGFYWRKRRLHDKSLVLYLPFDKDDGSYARDRSGYNKHGTIYGAVHVAGNVGDGLSFDGIDDYVSVPDSPYFRGSELTIMAWVNIAAVGGSGWQYLLNIPYSYNNYGWALIITAPGTYVVFVWNWTGNHSTIYWSEDVTKAGWINIAVTYSESNATAAIYRNGVLKSSVTGITPYVKPSSSPLTINNYKSIKGLIDEVRIYNRALSQAEIVRIMNMRGI